jgi:hypothetical protein
MILDTERFNSLLIKACGDYYYGDDKKIVDDSLVSKGIIVLYHNKQYKKKVLLTVNPNVILDGEEPCQGNADKLVRKLDKRISGYFGTEYTLDDFNLSKMYLSTDINVGSRAKVADYIRVLKRIGKVKAFSPSKDNEIGADVSFCLKRVSVQDLRLRGTLQRATGIDGLWA